MREKEREFLEKLGINLDEKFLNIQRDMLESLYDYQQEPIEEIEKKINEIKFFIEGEMENIVNKTEEDFDFEKDKSYILLDKIMARLKKLSF